MIARANIHISGKIIKPELGNSACVEWTPSISTLAEVKQQVQQVASTTKSKFEKMAGLRKITASSNLISVLRRQFSSQTILKVAAVDISNPAFAERSSESLSGALAAKEKGPWKELNKEDKIACKYYSI